MKPVKKVNLVILIFGFPFPNSEKEVISKNKEEKEGGKRKKISGAVDSWLDNIKYKKSHYMLNYVFMTDI